ncbi:MAG: hypothetical protein RhofKO_22100 [Rhodothermales bacterium]
MSAKRYTVQLDDQQRIHLAELVAKGHASARKITRARILLKADQNWTDSQIAHALDVAEATVARLRKRYTEQGLTAIERKKPERDYEPKLDGTGEAHLTQLACSAPPEGHARWSLRLLAEHMVRLEHVETLSHETVRQVLKKTN